MIRIQDLIQKNGVIIDLQGSDKFEVIDSMARFLCSVNGLANADEVSSKITAREMELSTGIGYGIAIPHARLVGVDALCMVAARSIDGLEFDSLDEQDVNLIFMMVSPANTSAEHTRVLSTLSQIMAYEEIRKQLLLADTPEMFVDVIVNAENKYISG